jgi:hypothetical protein
MLDDPAHLNRIGENRVMVNFKLGKKPAREGAIKFKLVDYLGKLPAAPASFGHQDLVSAPALGMLGNDQYGDCVWAGADHETMLWNAAAGATVSFTDATALADYAAVTGFDPSDPDSDQGTDMEQAAKYRRKTGIVDATGNRHTVGAYVALPGVSAKGDNSPSFLDALASAAYIFEAVGIGIEFPDSAMDQFNNGTAVGRRPGLADRGRPLHPGGRAQGQRQLRGDHLGCVSGGDPGVPAQVRRRGDRLPVHRVPEGRRDPGGLQPGGAERRHRGARGVARSGSVSAGPHSHSCADS